MKEKQETPIRRRVNTEILRALKDGNLAPEDLVFLDPQELFDVLKYLTQLPFNVEAQKPTNAEFNKEWVQLYRRVVKEGKTNDYPFSDLNSVTRTLFGDSMSSTTLYLLAEIIIRYFCEIGSLLTSFQSSKELLTTVSDSIHTMMQQMEVNEGTKLVKAPIELGAFKLKEALELLKGLELHKEEINTSVDSDVTVH